MSQNVNQPDSQPASKSKDRTTAGILALLLGGIGVHQFYLGNIGTGILRILMIVTLILAPVAGLIALVEGILYLTKTDEEFKRIYVDGNKKWF